MSAEIYPATPNGIGLLISLDQISPLTMERYFYFDYFVVEEDYAIPKHIWQRYGEAQVVKKGYYKILRGDGHIHLIFSQDNNLLSTLK